MNAGFLPAFFLAIYTLLNSVLFQIPDSNPKEAQCLNAEDKMILLYF